MSLDAPRAPHAIGNYEQLTKIAEGGMGAVYRAKNRVTGEVVAIKIIPPETAKNPILIKRFEQEYKAANQIDHPNVVKALDFCGTGPTPYLVMEFVDGESLGARVERDGSIPETEAIRIIEQVCEGLNRAHKQGLIHRDVKPDNILVTRDGVAKITDLGLVKEIEGETNLTRTGRGLGTPHFMAPEQFRNAKNVDVRCDIYSLAATLYTMLTGVVPFAKTSPLDCWLKKTKNEFPEPRALNPEVSERTNWAICRAMKAESTERPANCKEFMADLKGTEWKPGSGLVPTSFNGPESVHTPEKDIWYIIHEGADGQRRTSKASTEGIRRSIVSGELGETSVVLVCRTKTGNFQPLKSVPEFRDLVLSASGGIPSPARTGAGSDSNMRAGGGGRTPVGGSASRLPGVGRPGGSGRIPESPTRLTPGTPLNTRRQLPSDGAIEPPIVPPQQTDFTPWLVGLGAAVALAIGVVLFMK